MGKIELQKSVGNLLNKLQKLYTNLEIFSLPQAIENSWQFLLLRTDIAQKTVIWVLLFSALNTRHFSNI